MNCVINDEIILWKGKSIVGKGGENAGNQHFLPFSTMFFKKMFSLLWLNHGIVL